MIGLFCTLRGVSYIILHAFNALTDEELDCSMTICAVVKGGRRATLHSLSGCACREGIDSTRVGDKRGKFMRLFGVVVVGSKCLFGGS